MNRLLLAAAAPAAAVQDIHDIRPPLQLPEWWRWPLVVALVALAAFATIMLVRYWRRRRARALTPRERALEALLVAEEHARAGRSREWAAVIADAVRSALAARLGADVLPQTTTELARAELAGTALHEGGTIIALLETCDLARFAQASLVSDALIARTTVARDVVEQLLAPPLSPRPQAAQPAHVTP